MPDHKLVWSDRRDVWEVRWSEKLDGKWRSRAISTGEAEKPAAQAFLREFVRAEQGRDRATANETLALEKLVDSYVKAVPGQRWNLHVVRREMGAIPCSQIHPDDLHDLSQVVPNDSTRRRYLGALRAALNWGVDQKLVDPATVPVIALPREGPGRELFLDEREEAEFHAHAMGDSVGAKALTRVTRFVAVALDTGARKGAIEGLTWDRVDLGRGLIDFREPGRAVTRKRRGLSPISERLGVTLERAAKERTSKLSHVVGDGDIRAAYRTWSGSTPYSWATPHVLRHTFATLLIRAGVDVTEVAELLADDPATVMRRYRHHRPGWLKDAVNRRWT
jgi:integrase